MLENAELLRITIDTSVNIWTIISVIVGLVIEVPRNGLLGHLI